MSQKNRIHLKALVAFIFLGLFLGAIFGVSLNFGLTELLKDLQAVLSAQQEPMAEGNAWYLVKTFQPQYWYTVFPAIMMFSMLVAVIVWLFVRPGLKKDAHFCKTS